MTITSRADRLLKLAFDRVNPAPAGPPMVAVAPAGAKNLNIDVVRSRLRTGGDRALNHQRARSEIEAGGSLCVAAERNELARRGRPSRRWF